MNRLERVSAILVRLQSHAVIPARQIADQFGISLRTVYRDIRTLEEAGIPITGEAGIGYSLMEGYKLPPLMFTTEEAISFLMAEKLLSRQSEGDSYELFRGGMDKVRAVLRASEKLIVNDFDQYIQVIDDWKMPLDKSSGILQPLLQNIIRRKGITIEYYAEYNQEISNRTIDPLGIFFVKGNWYLLAWCRLRQDYRTFKIGRIRKLISEDRDFEKEHPDFKSVLNVCYTDDVTNHIRIRISKSGLRTIGINRYQYGLYQEEEAGDDIIQYYVTHSLEYFGRWFLSFADQAVILDPPELKEIVRQLVRNIEI